MGGRVREENSLFERCEAAAKDARAVGERTRQVLAECKEVRSRYRAAMRDSAQFVRRATEALRAAAFDTRDAPDVPGVQPLAGRGVPISEGMDGRVEKFPDREPSSPVGDPYEA